MNSGTFSLVFNMAIEELENDKRLEQALDDSAELRSSLESIQALADAISESSLGECASYTTS